jgi:hypothetical protein
LKNFFFFLFLLGCDRSIFMNIYIYIYDDELVSCLFFLFFLFCFFGLHTYQISPNKSINNTKPYSRTTGIKACSIALTAILALLPPPPHRPAASRSRRSPRASRTTATATATIMACAAALAQRTGLAAVAAARL